jgi:hypothetical protein
MGKGKKKKKPTKDESEEEEEKEEYDLDFDKLSKKDMIKIKGIFKDFKNKSCYLNNKRSISLVRLKSSRL